MQSWARYHRLWIDHKGLVAQDEGAEMTFEPYYQCTMAMQAPPSKAVWPLISACFGFYVS